MLIVKKCIFIYCQGISIQLSLYDSQAHKILSIVVRDYRHEFLTKLFGPIRFNHYSNTNGKSYNITVYPVFVIFGIFHY